MKNQSGITLVALLLVMLLLIILAGISISLVVTSDQEQSKTVKTPVVTELPPSVGELPSEEIEENIENTVETQNTVEE